MGCGGSSPLLNPAPVRDVYANWIQVYTSDKCTLYRCVKRGQKGSEGRQRQVAIKHRTKSAPGHVEAALLEVDALKRLDHPNVVRLKEYFQTPTDVHIVMDLYDGQMLLDHLKEVSTFNETVASQLFRQILAAVSHCHINGVVHRDIRPENFIYTDSSPIATLRLIGFGVAVVAPDDQRIPGPSPTLINYSSPEMDSGDYDAKADVWACGVVLHLMLSGQLPFRGQSDTSLMAAKRRGWKPSRFFLTTISKPARELLKQIFALDPAARPEPRFLLKHEWCRVRAAGSADPSARPCLPPDVIDRLNRFQHQQGLTRATTAFIAQHALSDEKRQELEAYFATLDTDGNGSVDTKEAAEALAAHLGVVDPIKAKELTSRLDVNCDGKIDFSEFVSAILDEETALAEHNLRLAFESFDQDGNGYLDKSELRLVLGGSALTSPGKGQRPASATHVWDAILADIDTSGDGRVDFEEFKVMMKRSFEVASSPDVTPQAARKHLDFPTPATEARPTSRGPSKNLHFV